MTEKEWVKSIIGDIEKLLRKIRGNSKIRVVDGHRLSYASEVLSYGKDNKPEKHASVGYETDILIYEEIESNNWIPRVVVETKLRVTTHDAITYSQKGEHT